MTFEKLSVAVFKQNLCDIEDYGRTGDKGVSIDTVPRDSYDWYVRIHSATVLNDEKHFF